MIANPKNSIAFQGIHGAYSDLACRRMYPSMETAPYPTFEDIFEVVQTGKATLGMIPIENSQAGRVAEIHNLLPRMNLFIVGEYFHQIEHHLLAPEGSTLDSVERVYSHPQALMQCRQHLRKLGVKVHDYSDTALAARDVAEWNDPTKAALASDLAGELYDLKTLVPNMEDSKDNTTVFITIAKESIDPNPDKGPVITSMLFTTRNVPAALYKALGGFATNKVNLLKLESYIPGRTKESAQFFVTFEGHAQERSVQLALEELRFFCESVTLLGSYSADSKRFA